jgi:predicted neuraminidase
MKRKTYLFLLPFVLFNAHLLEAQEMKNTYELKKEFIFETLPTPSCHASTIAETKNGLVAAWFGGKHEKNPDVEIWVARKTGGAWSKPVAVANGIQASGQRFPCWNPVLYQVPNGKLMLFYKVGPDPIDWWGELVTSDDQGLTWSAPQKLPQGILGPIKNKPVLLKDGRLICPSSTEYRDGRWEAHLETTKDFGKTWEKSAPLNNGTDFHLIQPSVLVYSNNRLQLLCRSKEKKIVSLWSHDNGISWSAPDTISLPNPNSGTDAVTLNNGYQLLIYNHTEVPEGKWGGPRTPLNLAISKDGKKWIPFAILENEPGEFSYPAMILDKDNTVQMTYTWNRTKVRHVTLQLTDQFFKNIALK